MCALPVFVSEAEHPRPNPSNPFPLTSYLIENSAGLWKAYVEHDFVRLLGMGILDQKSFIHFLK